MATRKRVLIVDDHPFIREGIRFYLNEAPQFEVVGEACDGPDAVRKSIELLPDVIVMDLRLPGFDGLEATRRVRQIRPSVQVLMLSVENADGLAASALQAGAMGWVSKDSPPEVFIHALECIQPQPDELQSAGFAQ